MFQKILIANRGEIACRVAATARRLGVQTVAVYSDADVNALHVQACDEAVRIGPPSPQQSYLRADLIVGAAHATGAQAVHPGYGFLSENADFAQACADAGLVFIGPPPSAIRAMGLKAESKRLMALAGVALVPGYHGADQDLALLQREAERIGYPVLIKASAGGGGKGMRVVQSPADFDAALASCQREALHSFGDAAVLIERYLARSRHIEIQVFADQHGNVVHLFERDCSVQRRHQKVLEEAPAPGMTDALRQQMGAAAVAAAQAVGYVGAGTVEFIAEPVGAAEPRFFFMEMNTRLQVEHPVTEAITGIDLVEWQLRVAAGERLPQLQHELAICGHAIEARICAENPDAQFLPATGRLEVARWPAHGAFSRRFNPQRPLAVNPNAVSDSVHDAAPVRLDTGVREGDAIGPFYDSMIAKLIVWGADRAQALARLDQALTQTHIVGLHTNVAFLRRVIKTPSFESADLDTALIERERKRLFNTAPLPLELAAAGRVAHALRVEQALRTADPWSRRDGWRLHGASFRRFDISADGAHRGVHWGVQLERMRGGDLWLSVVPRGQSRESSAVGSAPPPPPDARAQPDCPEPLNQGGGQGQPAQARLPKPAQASGQRWLFTVSPCSPDAHDITLDGQRHRLTVYATSDPSSLPGPAGRMSAANVFTLFSAEGQHTVRDIDPIGQNSETHQGERLTAPMPGRLIALLVRPGQVVTQGEPLAVMEAMKMEHTLTAPRDGRVAELLYAVGDQVSEGGELLTLETE